MPRECSVSSARATYTGVPYRQVGLLSWIPVYRAGEKHVHSAMFVNTLRGPGYRPVTARVLRQSQNGVRVGMPKIKFSFYLRSPFSRE